MIYLDNAATSFPKPPRVCRAVGEAMALCANPGRGSHAAAREGARYAVIHYDPTVDWKDQAESRMLSGMVGVSSAVAIVSDPVEQQITASVTATPRILTGFTSTILGKQTMELHAACTMRLEN